ncbi:hypothetical protein CJO92_23440 (plasmid) [Ralstonia solanacearum]|uniref:Uncharacterized protein n=3 Tax=Ralstonia solanacearum species complex TaxID=3116862 RepID=A0AAD0WJ36_RALSL|nr:hypothetical protein B0B51_17740 [blood disease bacterium A2-HR MARDI]AXV84441.1 hypothetical protein CJO77_23425 [Ralstonia solanacearum]AXW55570.1 hypothetical protein CJO92_23440 [Ralstonia solanacearum]CBJ35782.1 hypothethical protein [Ralstonia solanacearum PSI07]CCA82481.1 hypothethical protein [blood disease bacterium R229]
MDSRFGRRLASEPAAGVTGPLRYLPLNVIDNEGLDWVDYGRSRKAAAGHEATFTRAVDVRVSAASRETAITSSR